MTEGKQDEHIIFFFLHGHDRRHLAVNLLHGQHGPGKEAGSLLSSSAFVTPPIVTPPKIPPPQQ